MICLRSSFGVFSRILSTTFAGNSSKTSIISSKSSSSRMKLISVSVIPLIIVTWSSMGKNEKTSTDNSLGKLRNKIMALSKPTCSIISSRTSATSTGLFKAIKSSLALIYFFPVTSFNISSVISSKVFSYSIGNLLSFRILCMTLNYNIYKETFAS